MLEMGRRTGALAAGLALLAAIGTAGTAGAATLKASYSLQGTRASQTPGAPDLVDIGPGNHFATETFDGALRQVLAFPRGGGLSLATSGLVDATSHSVVMDVRLDDVSGFRRLLDFSGGTADDGLYEIDGWIVIDVGPRLVVAKQPLFEDTWTQIALTSEATPAGQRTVVALNGTPVMAAATPRGYQLGDAGLRLFKDNVQGPATGEESAGAVACVLLYDGALTSAELGQAATDPLCPAPRPPSAALLGFAPGAYAGRTSQGLPIGFTLGPTSLQSMTFVWRARCADGHVHTNAISLGAARVRNRRFSTFGVLGTGGRARVTGTVRGGRASGTLSRWGGSAFRTTCIARGVRWHARLQRSGGSGT